MCGIFGYISDKKNAPEIILRGLKTLEYRGYDSWGIAVVKKNKILRKRYAGKIDTADKLKTLQNSFLGIGHTRWATHGGVTKNNAHPHFDNSNNFAVVHNGIVENYQALKSMLEKNGYIFQSDTDTEIIGNLLHFNTQKTSSFKKAFTQTCKMLKGSNAFLILDKENLQIAAMRTGSPLVIGLGQHDIFIASDPLAFLPYTKNAIYLQENYGAIISGHKYEVFNLENGVVQKPVIEQLRLNTIDSSLGTHSHHLIKEIHEQKQTIKKTVDINEAAFKKIRDMIQKGYEIITIGCGSASYCGMIAQYFFAEAGIQTTHYGANEIEPFLKFVNKKTICIAISQSGETADTIIASKQMQSKGAHIVALINARGSTLERFADTTLITNAGPEICVVSTKAFTSQLSTLYLLSKFVEDTYSDGQKNIHYLVNKTKAWLNNKLEIKIKTLAHQLYNQKHIFVIGKHSGFPTAMECALKLKEITYIHTESFAAGELKHGVIALIKKNTPCICLAPDENTKNEILSSAAELKARGAYIIGISPLKAPEFDFHVQTPEAKNLTIIFTIIACQLLAYFIAVKKKNDPDKPRNLAKSVTVK